MPKTILLVDDNTRLLETAKDILESAGYAVRTAESGAAAIRSLRESPSAKQLCPAMVVFLMTGEASVDLGAAKGVVHTILNKPVNPPELFASIRRVI